MAKALETRLEEFDEDFDYEYYGEPIKDIRAEGLDERDLMLFKFSSDYQACAGGFADLHMATGIIFDEVEESY